MSGYALEYYVLDILKSAAATGAKSVEFDLRLDGYGCVNEKGKHNIKFTVQIAPKDKK